MSTSKEDPVSAKIEALRKLMTEVALEKGFSSDESVKISQELDAVLNQLQHKANK
ncbi:Spo0E family sporulation regulatory protein-aspartic acid phosphatase [Halobacillus sp. K22]|uniref:Spo0E family sporulation regulatory protein-aspartic acid phosphatase n=1 Tax=Halobacillus sp. K22 TaxID=3457431 RepID=UPI003FCC9595